MDYTTNILRYFDRADDTAVNDGREWYPALFRLMREHHLTSGLTVRQCAAIYAATSINTGWYANLANATRAIRDMGLYSGTLSMICRKVNSIIALADATTDAIDTILSPDTTNLKIKCFTANISGDYDAVTVDRWAWRIATDFGDCPRRDGCAFNSKRQSYVDGKHSCGKVPTGDEYRAIANAYRDAATQRNVNPATMQAVTWCVVRGKSD